MSTSLASHSSGSSSATMQNTQDMQHMQARPDGRPADQAGGGGRTKDGHWRTRSQVRAARRIRSARCLSMCPWRHRFVFQTFCTLSALASSGTTGASCGDGAGGCLSCSWGGGGGGCSCSGWAAVVVGGAAGSIAAVVAGCDPAPTPPSYPVLPTPHPGTAAAARTAGRTVAHTAHTVARTATGGTAPGAAEDIAAAAAAGAWPVTWNAY